MVRRAGVLRDEDGLDELLASIVQRLPGLVSPSRASELETVNLFTVAAALTIAARRRHESRGAQFRADFPAPDDAWLRRQIVRRDDDGGMSVLDVPVNDPDSLGK